MSNDMYVYSLVTGQIYKTTTDDLPLLFPYQIPLINIPKNNCKFCYGRGYDSIDQKTSLYNPCKCIHKLILPDFDTSKVKIYLPHNV